MQSHTPWRPPAGLCSCRSDDDGSTRPYTTFSSLSAFLKCVGSVASRCASLCSWICLGECNSARERIPLDHHADIDSISRSTIILPATFVYVSVAAPGLDSFSAHLVSCLQLVYLIVVVAIGKSAVPIIAIAMIAAVYGLQAVIFILKREFMLIGWMIVYILA